jgi:PTS system fructose-specific IIC component
MARIIAVTACPTGIAHTYMAAEALKKTAVLMGHSISVETQGASGTKDALSEADLASAELVILAADTHVEMTRFSGKPVHETSTSAAIRHTRQVLEAALALIGIKAERQAVAAPATQSRKKIVAITACPTGIAHTFMAAEALKKAAAHHGFEIKVETQGSVGAKNTLTAEDIAAADVVIIGADTHVDKARFAGKAVYETSVGRALKETEKILAEAFTVRPPSGTQAAAKAEAPPAEKKAARVRQISL